MNPQSTTNENAVSPPPKKIKEHLYEYAPLRRILLERIRFNRSRIKRLMFLWHHFSKLTKLDRMIIRVQQKFKYVRIKKIVYMMMFSQKITELYQNAVMSRLINGAVLVRKFWNAFSSHDGGFEKGYIRTNLSTAYSLITSKLHIGQFMRRMFYNSNLKDMQCVFSLWRDITEDDIENIIKLQAKIRKFQFVRSLKNKQQQIKNTARKLFNQYLRNYDYFRSYHFLKYRKICFLSKLHERAIKIQARAKGIGKRKSIFQYYLAAKRSALALQRYFRYKTTKLLIIKLRILCRINEKLITRFITRQNILMRKWKAITIGDKLRKNALIIASYFRKKVDRKKIREAITRMFRKYLLKVFQELQVKMKLLKKTKSGGQILIRLYNKKVFSPFMKSLRLLAQIELITRLIRARYQKEGGLVINAFLRWNKRQKMLANKSAGIVTNCFKIFYSKKILRILWAKENRMKKMLIDRLNLSVFLLRKYIVTWNHISKSSQLLKSAKIIQGNVRCRNSRKLASIMELSDKISEFYIKGTLGRMKDIGKNIKRFYTIANAHQGDFEKKYAFTNVNLLYCNITAGSRATKVLTRIYYSQVFNSLQNAFAEWKKIVKFMISSANKIQNETRRYLFCKQYKSMREKIRRAIEKFAHRYYLNHKDDLGNYFLKFRKMCTLTKVNANVIKLQSQARTSSKMRQISSFKAKNQIKKFSYRYRNKIKFIKPLKSIMFLFKFVYFLKKKLMGQLYVALKAIKKRQFMKKLILRLKFFLYGKILTIVHKWNKKAKSMKINDAGNLIGNFVRVNCLGKINRTSLQKIFRRFMSRKILNTAKMVKRYKKISTAIERIKVVILKTVLDRISEKKKFLLQFLLYFQTTENKRRRLSLQGGLATWKSVTLVLSKQERLYNYLVTLFRSKYFSKLRAGTSPFKNIKIKGNDFVKVIKNVLYGRFLSNLQQKALSTRMGQLLGEAFDHHILNGKSQAISMIYQLYQYKIIKRLVDRLTGVVKSRFMKSSFEFIRLYSIDRMLGKTKYNYFISHENQGIIPRTTSLAFKEKVAHFDLSLGDSKNYTQCSLLLPHFSSYFTALIRGRKKIFLQNLDINKKMKKLTQGFDIIQTLVSCNLQSYAMTIWRGYLYYLNSFALRVMFRKQVITEIVLCAKQTHHFTRLCGLIRLIRREKRFATCKWLREILRKWRFVSLLKNMAKKKLTNLYRDMNSFYMNVEEECSYGAAGDFEPTNMTDIEDKFHYLNPTDKEALIKKTNVSSKIKKVSQRYSRTPEPLDASLISNPDLSNSQKKSPTSFLNDNVFPATILDKNELMNLVNQDSSFTESIRGSKITKSASQKNITTQKK